jgi:hypothetical protein
VIDRSRVLALFLRRASNRGMEGWKAMTRTDQDATARRRDELARDRGSRRLLEAIEAQRRLDERRADAVEARVPVGPRDPRFAYLARSHD